MTGSDSSALSSSPGHAPGRGTRRLQRRAFADDHTVSGDDGTVEDVHKVSRETTQLYTEVKEQAPEQTTVERSQANSVNSTKRMREDIAKPVEAKPVAEQKYVPQPPCVGPARFYVSLDGATATVEALLDACFELVDAHLTHRKKASLKKDRKTPMQEYFDFLQGFVDSIRHDASAEAAGDGAAGRAASGYARRPCPTRRAPRFGRGATRPARAARSCGARKIWPGFDLLFHNPIKTHSV